MQNLSTCLWFDDKAEEAVKFYTSIFNNSEVGGTSHYTEASVVHSRKPVGSILTIKFKLEGLEFLALNGGPLFKLTPAISYFVSCETESELDEYFIKLSEGGSVLMPLDKYPFSEKFAWVADKFGVSWQLNLAKREQKIAPFLMFVGGQHGRAEEAANFYVSQFPNSRIVNVTRWGVNEPGEEGTIKHLIFTLNGREFMVMDSQHPHQFTFSLATSLVANCDTQDEIDKLWKNLAEGGQYSECGWLMDKFGVSWQVVPAALEKWLTEGDEIAERVMAEVMKMKKLDIATLASASKQ